MAFRLVSCDDVLPHRKTRRRSTVFYLLYFPSIALSVGWEWERERRKGRASISSERFPFPPGYLWAETVSVRCVTIEPFSPAQRRYFLSVSSLSSFFFMHDNDSRRIYIRIQLPRANDNELVLTRDRVPRCLNIPIYVSSERRDARNSDRSILLLRLY